MTIDLTDREQLAQYLQDKHVQPEHSSGQNFLVCPEVPEATLAAMEGGPKKATELGAGLGTLTQYLAANDYEVRAIEKDARLIKSLQQLMSPAMRKKVDVVQDDLRECDWWWPEPYQLVGNIPYNLSGLIVRKLTQLDPTPDRAVLLVQKEVGDRLTAEAPNISLISLAVQLWGRADRLMNVPADCFFPLPKVTSQLVMLAPRSVNTIPLKEREQTLDMARIFFQAKRKQLKGVLKRQWAIRDSEAAEIFTGTGISKEARPQELSVEQWIELSHHPKIT